MSIPYPEDEYLLWLGRVSYSVSYFEWVVLGDLPHIPGLPAEFSVETLAGQTTGTIANGLKNKIALAKVADLKTREWLEASGKHLAEIATARNSILHARPVTSQDGQQRLNRHDPRRSEMFVIEIDRLEQLVADINDRLRDMSSRRLI